MRANNNKSSICSYFVNIAKEWGFIKKKTLFVYKQKYHGLAFGF